VLLEAQFASSPMTTIDLEHARVAGRERLDAVFEALGALAKQLFHTRCPFCVMTIIRVMSVGIMAVFVESGALAALVARAWIRQVTGDARCCTAVDDAMALLDSSPIARPTKTPR
jgi:hypothetical protein